MGKQRAVKPLGGKWPEDWSVGVRVWFERHGQTILEQPVADVLMAVERTRSISGAARWLGISYRHAWLLIQRANETSGQLLVETAVGGQQGGGSQLTEQGRTVLTIYQQVQQQVREAAAHSLTRILAAATRASSTVHLAAAISLQEVVAHVLSEFSLLRPTITVRTIFGASNELADQIAAGGPADLFLSASRQPIRQLVKIGRIQGASRCKLASNGLTVVGDESLVGTLRKPSDLRRFTLGPVIVADPACPLGECTVRFLRGAKLSVLGPRLLHVENSRAVVAALRAPGPRIGIIFSSDVANTVGVTTLLQVPLTVAMTTYEGGVIASSPARAEAADLLQFFRSKEAQRNFRRCGFTIEKSLLAATFTPSRKANSRADVAYRPTPKKLS